MICRRCKLVINPEGEYCKLVQYINKKQVSEGFYHIKCFLDRMNGGTNLRALQSRAAKIMSKAEQVIG